MPLITAWVTSTVLGDLICSRSVRSPGVAGLPKPLDGVRVAQEVGVNFLIYSSPLGGFFDDLPGPLAVYLEGPVVQPQLPVKGVALQPVGQRIRAGYQPGLLAFPLNMEHAPTRKAADLPGRYVQGLGDPQSCLEESEDQEFIPGLVPPLAGLAHAGDLLGGEVGHNEESPGQQGLG